MSLKDHEFLKGGLFDKAQEQYLCCTDMLIDLLPV